MEKQSQHLACKQKVETKQKAGRETIFKVSLDGKVKRCRIRKTA